MKALLSVIWGIVKDFLIAFAMLLSLLGLCFGMALFGSN